MSNYKSLPYWHIRRINLSLVLSGLNMIDNNWVKFSKKELIQKIRDANPQRDIKEVCVEGLYLYIKEHCNVK